MVLWSAPFFALTVFAVRDPTMLSGANWLVIVPVIAAAIGGWFLYTAVRTADEVLEKRIEYLGDGGDWIGLVFVVTVLVVAIPVYEIYRLVRPRPGS